MMTSETGVLYHGGIPGRKVGDLIIPAAPRIEDGCPICQARAERRIYTVGEYRRWLALQGPRAEPVLKQLAEAPEWEPVDPPTQLVAVYVTSDREYARWYAARSRGDLYRVRPVGQAVPSSEDHFPSWTCMRAMVVAIEERGVRLDRRERRQLLRRWKQADVRAALEGGVR